MSIAANTSVTAYDTLEFTLPFGVVRKVRITFPWGCAGLVFLSIDHNERQLWPTTPGEWFYGNDVTIEFEDDYLLTEAWNNFRLRAYNDDDTYAHTVTVHFLVDSAPFGVPPGERVVGV